MGPKKKARGAVVGVDIGSGLIKITEAKLTKTGVQVTGLAIAPTPQGVIENSVIVNPAGLGAAIKKLLNENAIKTRQCVSSVSGQSSVVLRVIEVPKMTREELAETMKWEVERHVPFSPTEVVMDFQPLEKPNQPADAQNMEVFLAVAQQDLINNHVETLLAAGLKPIAIDVEPLAAGRALIDLDAGDAKRQTVAILNIGESNTDLTIFENGLLTFPNPPLPVAGVNITRAVSESLGEDIETSDRLKKELARVDLERITSTAPGSGELDSGLGAEPSEPETVAFGGQAPVDLTPEDDQSQSGAAPPAGLPWGVQSTPGQGFTDTVDGPVFDLGGSELSDQPITPTFDLSDDAQPPAAQVEQEKPTEEVDQLDPQMLDNGDLRTRVGDAIAPVLVDLATELRRSLDYYKTRYQNQPEVIFLSGGTARMPNLDKFLAGELGIPVVVANPMANVVVTSNRRSAQYLSEVSPLFSVSLGLAVRDMLE